MFADSGLESAFAEEGISRQHSKWNPPWARLTSLVPKSQRPPATPAWHTSQGWAACRRLRPVPSRNCPERTASETDRGLRNSMLTVVERQFRGPEAERLSEGPQRVCTSVFTALQKSSIADPFAMGKSRMSDGTFCMPESIEM